MSENDAAEVEANVEVHVEETPRSRLVAGAAVVRLGMIRRQTPILANQRCQGFVSPASPIFGPIRDAENFHKSGQVITFHALWDVFGLVPLRTLHPGEAITNSNVGLWRYTSKPIDEHASSTDQ